MATRKTLSPDVLARPFQGQATASLAPAAVAEHTLETAAKHFAAAPTLDGLAAVIRRAIPRWLRALLPVKAIARAVARFVEQSLDPHADDPRPDA